jgi:hypothetical protein
MSTPPLQINLVFNADDQAWIRREGLAVPAYWQGHSVPPLVGDVVRFGGRQFVIQARVWEHDAGATVVRLFVGDARAESDTSLGGLA